MFLKNKNKILPHILTGDPVHITFDETPLKKPSRSHLPHIREAQ